MFIIILSIDQLSLMLKHERSCLLQRQKALDGEDMTKFPINVQDNFRQQKDLLQRQMSLLEDQTRLLSVCFVLLSLSEPKLIFCLLSFLIGVVPLTSTSY